MSQVTCQVGLRVLLMLIAVWAPTLAHAQPGGRQFCAIEITGPDPLAPPHLVDINRWNEAVGTMPTPTGIAAVRWDLFRGLRRLKGFDPITDSGAVAINDRGQIAGFISEETRTRPTVWDDENSPRDIPIETLGGVGGNLYDINNRGQVIGLMDFGPDVSELAAFFFDPRSAIRDPEPKECLDSSGAVFRSSRESMMRPSSWAV